MIIVDFTNSTATAKRTGHLYQWDYGQILRIQGLKLDSAVAFHFASKNDMETITRIGYTKDGVTDVTIPDSVLEKPFEITAFVYVTDADSGKTEYKITTPVIPRAMPEEYEDPDTKQMFSDVMEQLDATMKQASTDLQDAEYCKNATASDREATAADRAATSFDRAATAEDLVNVEAMQATVLTAGPDAIKNIVDKENEVLTNVDTAKNLAVSDINTAKSDAVYSVETAKTSSLTELEQKTSEGILSINSAAVDDIATINAAGQTASDAVASTGQTAVSAVNAAGEAAVADVNAAKTITDGNKKWTYGVDNSVPFIEEVM